MQLRGYRIKPNLTEQTEGSTIRDEDTKTFNVNLLIASYIKETKKYRLKALHFMLDTLAHELAHTVHWEHTYKHYELQAKLMRRFSKVLKKLKIKDSSFRRQGKLTRLQNRSDQ